MEYQRYVELRNKMLESIGKVEEAEYCYGLACEECRKLVSKYDKNIRCLRSEEVINPAKTESVVQKWYDEHREEVDIVTNYDKFLSVYKTPPVTGVRRHLMCPPNAKCDKPCDKCREWWKQTFVENK